MLTVYVTRPDRKLLERDPILAKGGFSPVCIVEVSEREAESRVLTKLRELISQTDDAEAAIVMVILDAFVGTAPGRFEGGTRWSGNSPEADTLLHLTEDDWEGKGQALLSLRLVWKVWAAFGERIRILVTTNGVKVDPETRYAFAQAFGEGRICRLYDWRASAKDCEYLLEDSGQLIAAGGQN
jgi:hypothetical protein